MLFPTCTFPLLREHPPTRVWISDSENSTSIQLTPHEKLLWSERGEHPASPTGRTNIPGSEIQVLLQRLLRSSIFLWFSPVLPNTLMFLSPGIARQQLCDTSLCQHCSGTDCMETILARRHFSCSLTQNPQLSPKLQAPKKNPKPTF